MQRSVNNAVPSNSNNMLVPDDEIVVERIPYNQEDLLMKENQVLKVGQTLPALKWSKVPWSDGQN